MDFSVSAIFSSLIFSAVGYYVFREGKKRSDLWIMLTGGALMIYSYITHGPLADWGVGIALSLLAYQLLKGNLW